MPAASLEAVELADGDVSNPAARTSSLVRPGQHSQRANEREVRAMTKTKAPDWANDPDVIFCIRVDFASGGTEYTTVSHAADLLDFIDREKGIADLMSGMTFRSHMGSMFRYDEGVRASLLPA
jgi:hypothetical protein